MYVISSLVMHENEKIASLYRQRFAIEISVLVEKICECRTEQLERVRRNIERWREKECFESLVLDECEYHVQKFEEAGKEAEEEERRKEEDGLLGMERIETPPPPEEEDQEAQRDEAAKEQNLAGEELRRVVLGLDRVRGFKIGRGLLQAMLRRDSRLAWHRRPIGRRRG